MATYVNNLRLKEIATGAESGTWGTSTNTNLELIADAFGSGTEAITTNADTHTTTIADGSADEGRAIYMKYTGTLDSACTITLAPNTINKFWIVENATSGSQNIIISQGSGANITIGNGKVAAIFTDGAGSGAAVLDAFADLELSTTLTVGTDLDVDGTTNLDAVDIDGAVQIDSTVTVGVDDTGYDVKFFGDTASAYMLWDTSTDDLVLAGAAGIDLAGDIDVDGTANLDIVDIDGAVDMASTLQVDGAVTGSAGITVTGASSGSDVSTFTSNAVADTNIAIWQRLGGAVAAEMKYVDSSTDMELGTSTSHTFAIKTADTRALTISTAQDVTIAGDLIVSGTGPHAIGTGANAGFKINLGGAYTGGSTTPSSLRVDGRLTSPASTSAVYQSYFANSLTTNASSHTVTTIAQVAINECDITLGSGSSATNSASLYIASAASEATNNYALWVDAGASRFDGPIIMRATEAVRFDGNASGDTYIYESSANNLAFTVGGTITTQLTATQLIIPATNKIQLDGSSAGDTYIHESTANTMQFVTAGSAVYTQTSTGIGINDTTPDYELSVHGVSPEIRFVETGSGGSKMFSIEVEAGGIVNLAAPQSGQQIEMSTVGTSALLIDASQNLLAGPTTSNAYYGAYPKVQIEDLDGTSAISIFRDSADANGPALYLGSSRGTAIGHDTIVQDDDHLGAVYFVAADGGDRACLGGEISCYIDGTPGSNDTPGRLVFGTTADGATSPTARMTILSTGMIGIGRSDPNIPIDIDSADFTNPEQIRVVCSDVSDAYMYIYCDGNQMGLSGSYGSGGFKPVDIDSGTAFIRLNGGNTGAVLVGSDVAVTTGGEGIQFRTDYGLFHTARNSSGTVGHWEIYNSNGEVGGVTTASSATAFNTSSDYRLKENESSFGDALDLLGQLKPYKFNFKITPDEEVQGFFAHEVAEIVPQAVTGEKDAVKDDGSIKVQSIDHSHMVPLLVAAIQELTAKVEALENG